MKELTAEFEMSQPAISQHLKELREAQLVVAERAGLEQRYRLTPAPLKAVLDWSAPYRRLIDPSGHSWAFTGTDTSSKGVQKQGGTVGR